jgi:hypothetical protein
LLLGEQTASMLEVNYVGNHGVKLSYDGNLNNAMPGPGTVGSSVNQNGDAVSGTLVFTHPQGGRVQVPISSGVVSKDALTFSGQNQFPMGSLELTFHGTVAGTTLTGTAEMTSRSMLIGPVANTASLNLRKQ